MTPEATTLWRRIGRDLKMIPCQAPVRPRPLFSTLWGILFAVSTCLAGMAQAAAPSAQLRVSRAPYYVGIPMEVQVHISGLNRDPEPTCEGKEPDGGSLRFIGLVPNISTQISIINGRTTRSENVTFVCQYQFTPRREGRIRLQPFRVTQDQTRIETTAYTVDAEGLKPDPKLQLRLRIPSEPVFVGQQVPIGIEWWVDERLQESIQSYEIRSELFDDPDTFRFLPDERIPGTQQTLNIQTSQEQLMLPARARQSQQGDNRYVVISSERTLIPLRAGRFDLQGATVNANEVTAWRRDLFGGRRPASTRPIFAQDSNRTLVVKPPPASGRPESFGGGVGRGFSFAVETDRSVVQAGDPIVLTFTVTGSGELAPVGLPPLDSLLPAEQFRLPGDAISGQVVTGTKAFRVPVRVMDENVTEIPALPYSWFDPELAEYQTTYSLPIALSVRPAQIVSADDVVTGRTDSENAEEAGEIAGSQDRKASNEDRRSFSAREADLAIEINRSALEAHSSLSTSGQATVYGISLLGLAAAWLFSRRRNASPDRARQRAREKALRARIEKARDLPPAEALAEMAAALRELAARRPDLDSGEVGEFIAACDDILYAPGDMPAQQRVQENADRALELADGIIAHREEVSG